MSPIVHLYLVVLVTLAAYAVSRFDRARHRRVLQRVAAEFQLNYSADDPFRLVEKVIERFPVPGAARLVITDLVYGIRDNRYRYIFTAQYTVGAVRVRKRLRRVAAYTEPVGKPTDAAVGEVLVASPELTWADQYRALAKSI